MRILKKESWPHKISTNYVDDERLKECHIWLKENVGEYQYEWNMVYYYKRQTDFYFKDGRYATLFSLRWS